ncbi:isopentenyl-diphosphate Delta-isomerase [Amycolatopsis sp. QT-25]|uniref:isopentenyl-diphosphate Delta-isomerase n=1 Tax=Amycolatopsis sp. QT-25 TaxID=3034022 RepID=UPI0023EC91EF|nr:isopentenyl-diphosphate Delta-isomerase [Amycolatopsis sp. QT-25]WET76790.1 isopentenyl-diphosphate Delta-isomerase [Amycolatopsis sp. QT-25]
MTEERVVYVTEDGTPTGETAPKLAAHHAETRLHLAFSCYLTRKSDDALLVTRRALVKKVWPGVWTNSVCGHPAPGETLESAVVRRAAQELGLLNLADLRCVLPSYRYRTPPFNGVVENEFCPVFTARVDVDPEPDPAEVEEWRWISWDTYREMIGDPSSNLSYWAKDQFHHLDPLIAVKTDAVPFPVPPRR